jgi:hypothetical protein
VTDADRDRRSERAAQDPGDLIPALSARQIVGGVALLAAIVMLLRRRNRGSTGTDEGEIGKGSADDSTGDGDRPAGPKG